MNKNELLTELQTKFEEIKKELNFRSNFQEINEFSFIEDLTLAQGFVSNQFSRQLINRITETYSSWIGTLHNWIIPNPHDMMAINEASKLTEDEKNEINKTINKIMYFIRKNKRIAFEKNKKEEGPFIDELIQYSKEFTKFMAKYHKKFEIIWKDDQ